MTEEGKEKKSEVEEMLRKHPDAPRLEPYYNHDDDYEFIKNYYEELREKEKLKSINDEVLQQQNNNLRYNCELKDEQIYNERFRFGLVILFLADLFIYSVVSNALAVCSLTVLEVLFFLHVFHSESKEFINRSIKSIFEPFNKS